MQNDFEQLVIFLDRFRNMVYPCLFKKMRSSGIGLR